MRTATVRLPIAAMIAIVIAAVVELTAWQFGQQSPPLKRLERHIAAWSGRPTNLVQAPVQSAPKDKEGLASDNPFFNQPRMQEFMPFITFGGALGVGTYTQDYFGFRNYLGDAAYFSPHKRPVIVMTGNSELAGNQHRRDIAVMLEEELKRRGLNFDVVNLAVNSYSLAAEIGAYVHFGDKTCPSLVIAHSGGVEYAYGMVVPSRFRQLGLNYHPPLEEWAYRMYNLREYTGPSVWRQRDPDAKLEDTVEAAKSLLEQYRTIVERNKKTVFLFGAQKIGSSNPLFPFWTKKTRDEYMSQLRASIEPLGLNYIWFDDDERIQLVDSMHSDEKSGRLIADIYATWIEEHRSQLDLEVAMTCPWSKQR